MNWYREYQAEWKEIIETVARELGRSEQMVEKDTIQSMFLYELVFILSNTFSRSERAFSSEFRHFSIRVSLLLSKLFLNS